jgi:HD-GYP domain-containing protein (c-di-GMP phosphodiesterase class II)
VITFRCIEGSCKGRLFDFSKSTVTIGRGAECDVALDDELCSRRHARIDRQNGFLVVTDLHSTNGLFVNRRRVTCQVMRDKDRFAVGRHIFEAVLENARRGTGATSGFLDGDGAGRIDSVEDGEAPTENTIIESSLRLDEIDSLFAPIATTAARPGSPNPPDPVGKQALRLQLAYRVSQAINATLETEDLYPLIVENIFSTFEDAERACLFLKGKHGSLDLIHSAQRGRNSSSDVSRCVLERVELERVGVLASDAKSDDRFSTSKSVAIMDLRSLMCVPLVTRNKFLGAIYVENCTKVACFTKAELELLSLLANQMAYAIDNAILYRDIQHAFYETVRSLSNALEAKDPYTRGHSDRVARYAVGIGSELGFEEERLTLLRIAAELHDIGKIGISEQIIGKAGRLTEAEFEIIKLHPQAGVDILQPVQYLRPILPFILHHHERFNGRGYPAGLAGDAIPLEARIINLADAFDAMTTKRSYNQPRTRAEAIEQCHKEAGVSFDRDCVEAFVRYLNNLDDTCEGSMSSDGALATVSER